MSPVRIGLVTEGPTDQLVIRELVPAFLEISSVKNTSLEFTNLQPTQDRTSTTGTAGGWECVYKWCLSNRPSRRDSGTPGHTLFAEGMDATACDVILVHMDSDVCEQISFRGLNHYLNIPDAIASPYERGSFIRQVIESWLWPDGRHGDSEYIISPAVEAIEAWLVAGLSSDSEPESNHEIQKRLAELDHEVVRKQPVPGTIKSPKKTRENYRKILELVKPNIQRIHENCRHFQTMVEDILQRIKEDL